MDTSRSLKTLGRFLIRKLELSRSPTPVSPDALMGCPAFLLSTHHPLSLSLAELGWVRRPPVVER